MPTKRVPRHRNRHPLVTAEAVALFQKGEALKSIYKKCIRGGRCKSPDVGQHCSECREYLEITKRLNWTLLRLDVGGMSVFDAELDRGGPVPASLRGRCIGETWDETMALRRALQEAVREEAEAAE